MHWITKDGERRLIAWSDTVLLDSRGEVEHMVSTGIDVTERRAAEEQLGPRRATTAGPDRSSSWTAWSTRSCACAATAGRGGAVRGPRQLQGRERLARAHGSDELLRAISERLQAAMRPSDTLARSGATSSLILSRRYAASTMPSRSPSR